MLSHSANIRTVSMHACMVAAALVFCFKIAVLLYDKHTSLNFFDFILMWLIVLVIVLVIAVVAAIIIVVVVVVVVVETYMA